MLSEELDSTRVWMQQTFQHACHDDEALLQCVEQKRACASNEYRGRSLRLV